jgi:translation initiation factor 2B subunit (eIF-2B alpha/beta/delta family)
MAAREILASTEAGHPRGSWPAEEQAQTLRAQGIPVTVVMDQASDRFLVVREGGQR